MNGQRILALDFGGTRMRAAWIRFNADFQPTIDQRAETPTLAADPVDTVIARLITLAQQVIPKGEQPEAVGIAAPGPHDAKSGVIYHSYTLPGWKDVPLAHLLADALGAPVFMQNDGNLGAVAEYMGGAGKGCNPMIYMTISTGIGGGVMIDGKLFTGWSGLAAEPGHQMMRSPEGDWVRLEAIASGTAIGQRAGRDGAAVARAAEAGDGRAIDVINTVSQYLGMGIVSLLHLFSPEAIVIGGSVAKLGDRLFDPVRAIIQEQVLDPRFVPPNLIRPAHFGEDVCLIGAAMWAVSQQAASQVQHEREGAK
ncbi:MAG: ROK family protein [Anaerolineae bacterium]